MSDTLEDFSDLAHAPLGPSSAEGWATCADYVNANRGLPNYDTYASAEGTFAHHISDMCLSLGLNASDFIGFTMKIADWTFKWEEDDAWLLQRGIDFVNDMPGMFFGEHRVDISAFTIPGQFGTLDRGIIADDLWTIIDLKWGRGVAVTPFHCMQLMLYALGFWRKYRHLSKATNFRLIIDQPRHPGGGGVWETTLEQLEEFAMWIHERAQLTTDPNAVRTATAQGCQWCRRRRAYGGCDEFDRFMFEVIGITPEELDLAMTIDDSLPLPRNLDADRRSFILQHRKLIDDWLETMSIHELSDGSIGLPTPGRKLVLDRATKAAWADKVAAEQKVTQLLGAEGFKSVLKTPKQITAIAKDDALDEIESLIIPGEKQPKMVSAADARPALIPFERQFDDLPPLAAVDQ